MKVFENIDAFRKERLALAGLDTGMEFFTSELKRIITDLIPMRKSRQATDVYFHHNLCHDENVRKFQESVDDRRRNGEEVIDDEYRMTKQECRFSEDLLHPALIRVLRDDRYSFGHLYWFLCSRYNRQAGYAFYDDIVVSDEVIDYAVDFDIEELQENVRKLDMVDRLDYLDMQLIASRGFNADPRDSVLMQLKERYENLAQDMIKIHENRLNHLTGQPSRKSSGQVKEIPMIEDSIGRIESGQEKYLTYYDFTKCPMDVSNYPFSVHLSTYHIVRTERGLEDSNPIFTDILTNVYKQASIAGERTMKELVDSSRELFETLYKDFFNAAIHYADNDFDQICWCLRWWSQNSIRCLDAAFKFDFLPTSNAPIPEDEIENERANAWRKCDLYRKMMSEYSLYLTMNALKQVPSNPYIRIYDVIPFNYYGDKYAEVIRAASKKILKNEEDREATNYLANCGKYLPYLEDRLEELNGKEINDSDAVAKRHALVRDLLNMSNDYLLNLKEIGIEDAKSLKYAFEIRNWLERETMNYLLRYYLNQTKSGQLPYSLPSKEKEKLVWNTLRQYESFLTLRNTETVKSTKDFYNMCAIQLGRTEPDVTDEIIEDIEPEENTDTNTADVKRDYYLPKHPGTVINVEVIYNLIKGLDKTSLLVEDFEEAIKYADFAKLMDDARKNKAKDYPLIIITKIKHLFNNDWYVASCQSIGIAPTKVSGYHRDGISGKISFRFPSNLTK